MKNRIYLSAGNPDDDNRDYLPEKIKGTDIVVNENGNNSQPYPKRLKECRGVLADGLEDVWFEYVPESYDPSRKTPLVLSMHGGLMTGWGQAIYTSWTLAADRDGFIVVFPNANYGRCWEVKWGKWEKDIGEPETETNTAVPPGVKVCPEDERDNHDVKVSLALIEKMKQQYNIDEGRIYMQGMSMGNMMTSLFARTYGNILAGAAGSGCATFLSLLFDREGHIINRGGALPIWQSRPENNDIPPEKDVALRTNKYNRLYWMRINGCERIPEISIQGENNLAFYTGSKADLVYLDIKNRDHGQTFDDACLIWDYLFSGVRRAEDGSIERIPSIAPRKGDKYAISVAAGCSRAWVNGSVVEIPCNAVKWQKLKYHGLEGGTKVRGEYICVPLSFLADLCSGKYEVFNDGLEGLITTGDGRALQFARGSIGCVLDGTVRSMYCEAIHREGELLVSLEWFCKCILNYQVSCCDDVIYATDHWNELSINMADLMKDLLSGQPVPKDFERMIKE